MNSISPKIGSPRGGRLVLAAIALLFTPGCAMRDAFDSASNISRSTNNTRSARFTNTYRSTGFARTAGDASASSGSRRLEPGESAVAASSQKPPVKLHMRANRPDSSRFHHESATTQRRRETERP